MATHYYILICRCVCGLQQYDNLNNSGPFAPCLLCFVILSRKTGEIDVSAIFIRLAESLPILERAVYSVYCTCLS